MRGPKRYLTSQNYSPTLISCVFFGLFSVQIAFALPTGLRIIGESPSSGTVPSLRDEGAAVSRAIENEPMVDIDVLAQLEEFRKANLQRRIAFVKLYGERADYYAVEMLLMGVVDQYPLVRQAAVEELKRIGEPLGSQIYQAIEGSEEARQQLASLQDLRAIRALASALDHLNISLHWAAWDILNRIKDDRVVDPVVKILQSGSPRAKVASIYILMKFQDPRITGLLIAASADVRYEVREAAMYALRNLTDERALNSLLVGLEDPNPSVREAAAYGLANRSGRKEAVAPLIKAMADRDVKVRVAATWTIASYNDLASFDALVRNLRSDDHKLPIAAAYSLGRLGNKHAVEPLAAVLGNQELMTSVRVAAATALGQLADKGATDSLIKAMNVDNIILREQAFLAATKISDPELTAAVLRSLGNKSTETREMAWSALRDSRESTATLAVSMFEGTLDEGQVSELREDTVSMSILTGVLGNPRGEVRRAAARGLSVVEDTRVIQNLRTMAGGWNLCDKYVAIGALAKVCGFLEFLKNIMLVLLRPATLAYIVLLAAIFVATNKSVRTYRPQLRHLIRKGQYTGPAQSDTPAP